MYQLLKGGRSFHVNLAAFLHRFSRAIHQHRLALACFSGSLLLFEFCWGARFYIDETGLGHDFSATGVWLLEGKYWVDSNGLIAALLNPPWFTPAWCAGTAFYADPQSVFYSPLQWFALVVDPFKATHFNALLFSAVAFWGSYALAHKLLGWSTGAAVIFAALGMTNTFLPFRSAVGEAGYQPFYIWTLLALALCWPAGSSSGRSFVWPVVVVSLCLTAWLQFGFAGMMVPACLATGLFCLALVLMGRASFWLVCGRSIIGGVVAILLNASKIYTSASLMRNFPRDFYQMPGFATLQDALVSIPLSLILPSEWTAFYGLRRMVDVQWIIFPHEWAMNFGFGALAMALLFGVMLLKRPRRQTNSMSKWGADQFLALGVGVVILIIPVLLLWVHGPLNALIKQIPILNSATWPMRWIVIYIPLFQLLLAFPAGRLFDGASNYRTSLLTLGAASLIWLGPLTEPVDYYLSRDVQSYRPAGVINAFEQSRTGPPTPIDRIALSLIEDRNDTMLEGASQGLCYNPIYGYRLEGFPQLGRLKEGPALEADQKGQSLIFNPACLVHPAENDCAPGDGFRMHDPNERASAERFLARKPFTWRQTLLGDALSVVSQICFWVLLMAVTVKLVRILLQFARSTDPRPEAN